MILDFDTYCLNEKSLKGVKKTLHGVLGSTSRAEMRKILRKHIVYFKFKKKNGELRRAVGTLISSYLPALRGGAPKPEHQMVYYDLEKKHWRSFRSFSFIKIIDIKSKEEYEGRLIKKKEEEEKKEKLLRRKELHKEKLRKEKEREESEKEEKDIKKKTFDVGDKIPEKELMRRSTDFRKGSRKNDFTKKSNDAKKKGELDEDNEEDD